LLDCDTDGRGANNGELLDVKSQSELFSEKLVTFAVGSQPALTVVKKQISSYRGWDYQPSLQNRLELLVLLKIDFLMLNCICIQNHVSC
jgi:hypothetical protein